MKRVCSYRILKISVLFTALLTVGTQAKPPPDSNYILKKVQSRLDPVSDYSASVNVDVDIPNLRMPAKELQIYYKRPDKFKVRASGFAIIPKIGFIPSQTDLLSKNSTIELRSTPDQNDSKSYILDLRPTDSPVDMVTTIWVNAKRWTIEKVLVNVPDRGESVITIQYVDVNGIWLPDTTTVYLNMMRSIPEMRRPTVENPVGFAGDKSGNEPMSGTISIRFKDYRLNQGLKDKLFEE
ncbi:hypothetical protein KJ762_01230 [bacterium]|nr:hypothetical protein [bacterium]MBU1064650.1 hypothetical protein [bacterium]MBU1633111.1 hypothetical protein [bacterium]MBU1874269.1 hypothetical protein [bacterium]